MNEVVACRMTLNEKRLVQALAARRETCVAHLIRDLLLSEIADSMGEQALVDESWQKGDRDGEN